MVIKLSNGLPTVLVASQVYALPATSSQISWQSAAGSDLQVSNDGVSFTSIGVSTANQTLSAFTAAAFVKCATANTIVITKNAPIVPGVSGGGSGSINITGDVNATGNINAVNGNFDAIRLDRANQDVILQRDAANILALKNGTNLQTFRVYGTAVKYLQFQHDGSHGNIQASNGHIQLFAQAPYNSGFGIVGYNPFWGAAGTATSPAFAFAADTDTGFYSELANVVSMSAGGTRAFLFQAGILNFRNDSATIYFGSADDLAITREAANTLAQRNGVNAQTFNIYNTYTNASNYERLQITCGAAAQIMTQNAGTGTAKNLFLGVNNSLQWLIQGTTGHFLANTDNAYDIGASGANRPRNIYAAGTINAAGNATCNSLTATDSGGAVTTTLNITSAVNARVLFNRSDQATDAKLWSIQHGGSMLWVTLTDAGGVIGNQLALSRTGNLAIQSTGSLVNRVKAGTPVDGDVTTPTDGMMMVDSSANKIWVRLGGTWKGVVVS